VFVIGSLGAGKSTVISALNYLNYEEALKDAKFEASKELSGFTKTFTQSFSPILQSFVTDSPGLGDA
jgi:putative ribosome biogenesis GTPase RsgA